MKTNEFRSLSQAALSVTQKKHQTQSKSLNESVQINENPEVEQFVNFVSNLIEMTENELNTQLSAEEISEVTDFVLAKIGTEYIIEHIENEIGFELNENEIEYVINTLNESA